MRIREICVYIELELDTKICSYSVYKHKRISAFIIEDKTAVQIGSQQCLVMDMYRTINKFCAWNLHFGGEKHACCCKIHDLLLRNMVDI